MDDLLEREKVARLNGDKEAAKQVLEEMVDRATSDKETLDVIRLASKKKGQIKEALWKMIQYSYDQKKSSCTADVSPYSFRDVQFMDLLQDGYRYTPQPPAPKDDPFLAFLQQLLASVVEGKIYLEGLRILLTDTIKQILLAQNRVEDALNTIYSVHIETFSSISVEDVVLFQLEQMRLAIRLQDRDKCSVLSKRISRRHLEEVPTLKPYFWNRMLFVYLGEKDYHQVADIFNEIRKTEEAKESGSFDPPTMAILYAILSLHHPSTDSLLKQNLDSKLCPDNARVLGELFRSTRLIKPDRVAGLVDTINEASREVFRHHADEVQRKLLEHNLLVVSKYYTRITLGSIAQLFGSTETVVTELITEMIRANLLSGTVDQLTGTVAFNSASDELSEWGAGINSCLDLVIKITHQIAKTQ